jgi:hypothetical protein
MKKSLPTGILSDKDKEHALNRLLQSVQHTALSFYKGAVTVFALVSPFFCDCG